MTSIRLSSGLHDGLPTSAAETHAKEAEHHCPLCRVTGVGHGLLPIAGSVFGLLALALVFAWR